MSMKTPDDTKHLQHVSVNIRFQYRRNDGKIWSVRVMDTWRVYPCSLYGLDNHGHLEDYMNELGIPRRTQKESRILDSYWWVKRDLGFHLWIYSVDWSDVGITHRAGEAQFINVCSLKLTPPGVEAWFTEAAST